MKLLVTSFVCLLPGGYWRLGILFFLHDNKVKIAIFFLLESFFCREFERVKFFSLERWMVG